MKISNRQHEADETPSPPARSSRLGWWVSRLFVLLLMLAVLAWFAPTIVANTPAWNWLLTKANEQLPVQVATGKPQLGWLSPIVVPAVQVVDAEGQPVAFVESFQTEKTLLALALDQTDLGTIKLVKPHLRVELPRPKVKGTGSGKGTGSERETEPTGKEDFTLPELPQLTVQIEDGTLDLHDQETDRIWTAAPLQVVASSRGSGQPLEFDTLCTLAASGPSADSESQPAGTMHVKGNVQLNDGELPSADVHVELANVDTAVIRPLANQAGENLHVAGLLTLRCDVQNSADGLLIARLAELSSEQLAVAAPEYLGEDVLRLRNLGGQGNVTMQGTQIAAQQAVLVTDFARLEADGVLRLGEMTLPGLFQAFASGEGTEPLKVGAQVDLAQLIRQLPHTIPLREGTEVRSGQFTLQVQRDSNSPTPRVTGQLQASDLVAINDGRAIRLEKPVAMNFAVGASPRGPQLESLACDSEFLQMNASGTLAQGSATIQSDLNQLMRKLNQVVDMPELALAGTINGEVRWQQGQGGSWQAETGLMLREFHARLPEMLPWREKELQLTAAVTGVLADNVLQRIDHGTATINAANDHLQLELTGPVNQPSAESEWPVAWDLTGDVASWLPRLQPLMSVKKMRASGGLKLQGAGTISPTMVALNPVQLTGENIKGTLFDLNINEDQLQLKSIVRWDGKNSTLELPSTTFASSTLAFQADRLALQFGDEGFSATGSVDYNASAERLAALTADPRRPADSKLEGLLGGRITLQHAQGRTQATIHGTVDGLVYSTFERPRGAAARVASAGGWKEQWKEPKIGIKGGLAYDAAADRLELGKLLVQAAQIQLETDGTISQVSAEPVLDLHGTIAYDLEDVTLKLRPILGDSLALTGKELREFSVSGPLSSVKATSAATSPANAPAAIPDEELISPELNGELTAGWETASYLGLQIGAADFAAKLQRGNVNFSPIEIPINQGRLMAQPQIQLNNSPSMVTLPQGVLLDHVEITPELCHGWLLFVAPLLADATSAQGQFSVDLEGAAIPLFDPEDCEVAGTTQVHAATVGPGPLATQLIGVIQQIKSLSEGNPLGAAPEAGGKTWLKISEEQVAFRVAQQRVYHQGMKITIKDVQITTEGSVGFDQSLELLATVPIQDAWLKKDLAQAGLKGKTIQVPIRGTIAHPQIDKRAFEQLAKQMVRDAAQGVLENELNKGLQKLFGPKP